jgi:hypothetical protein
MVAPAKRLAVHSSLAGIAVHILRLPVALMECIAALPAIPVVIPAPAFAQKIQYQ